MKANKAQIERALRSPPPEIRFFLLYGPDEAGSRALMKMLGAGAERVELSGQELDVVVQAWVYGAALPPFPA